MLRNTKSKSNNDDINNHQNRKLQDISDIVENIGTITSTIDDVANAVDTVNTVVSSVQDIVSSACFSSRNYVEIRDRSVGGGGGKAAVEVPMNEVKVGDYVRDSTSSDSFSRVISLGHVHHETKANFFQIFYDDDGDDGTDGSNYPLEITARHMVYVSGKGAIPAENVRVGDELFVTSSKSTSLVTKVENVERVGVYAPVTESGKLVVSGILSSSYYAFLDDKKTRNNGNGVLGVLATLGGVSSNLQNFLSHLYFAPLRAICKHRQSVCQNEKHTKRQGYSGYAYPAIRVMEAVNELPLPIQYVLALTSIPFFLVALGIEQCVSGGTGGVVTSVLSMVLLGFVFGYYNNNNLNNKNSIKIWN